MLKIHLDKVLMSLIILSSRNACMAGPKLKSTFFGQLDKAKYCHHCKHLQKYNIRYHQTIHHTIEIFGRMFTLPLQGTCELSGSHCKVLNLRLNNQGWKKVALWLESRVSYYN